jgi:hypothetical protein
LFTAQAEIPNENHPEIGTPSHPGRRLDSAHS